MSWAKDPTSADGSRIQRVIEAHVGIQIPGVPPTITREDYRALVGSVGLDPAQLLSLTFGHASIEAEVFALDHEGRRYAEGNEVATHRVRIEVVD